MFLEIYYVFLILVYWGLVLEYEVEDRIFAVRREERNFGGRGVLEGGRLFLLFGSVFSRGFLVFGIGGCISNGRGVRWK